MIYNCPCSPSLVLTVIMISSIEKLKRAFESDPNNEGLKQQLVQALFREGRKAEARDLVKGHFRCPLEWDELSETGSQGVRDCAQCQKEVHFVWSVPDMHEKVQQNHCIAGPQRLVDDYVEAVAERLWINAEEKETPCVFQSDLPIIEDLEAVATNEDLIETLFQELTGGYRIVPIRIHEDLLEIACDEPLPHDILERVQSVFPLETGIKEYLASSEQITGVINKFAYLINDMFMGDIYIPDEPSELDDPEFADLEDSGIDEDIG